MKLGKQIVALNPRTVRMISTFSGASPTLIVSINFEDIVMQAQFNTSWPLHQSVLETLEQDISEGNINE